MEQIKKKVRNEGKKELKKKEKRKERRKKERKKARDSYDKLNNRSEMRQSGRKYRKYKQINEIQGKK